MTHLELHAKLSEKLKQLDAGKITEAKAAAYFKGSREIISLCKTQLHAVNGGYNIDVPLLGIKQVDTLKQRRLK